MEPYSLKSAGFTLIELLIVLVLMGLASSLILPNLWGHYEKMKEKDVMLMFSKEVNSYRLKAFQKGSVIGIYKTAKEPLKKIPALPKKWKVDNKNIMYFFPSGVTSGGLFRAYAPSGRTWNVLFTPIYGQVSIYIEK